ncbi:MAG: hypothetical protein M3R51_06425, partial [Candidatus Eremiobacteraeota bacterium]|nr:hypothetical protein [Candidatus Eremiobacteraeota bacterium]
IVEFAKESPFVIRGADGSLAVHPLLATLLCEHREESRAKLLRRVAAEHQRTGNLERAAELYLACGDREAAAFALGAHDVLHDESLSAAYVSVLASLDRPLVARHPRLWAVTALLRLFCIDAEELLDEAESIWRTLPANVTPVERHYVLAFRIYAMLQLGLLEDASSTFDESAETSGRFDAPRTVLDAYLWYLRALLHARAGRLSEAERNLAAALPFLDKLHLGASITYRALGAEIARVRGERSLERRLIERAIERGECSGFSNFAALDYAEAIIGAWFAGESDAMADYAMKLDDCVNRFGVSGLAYFAAVARGRSAEPRALDLPRYVVFGTLMAIAANADDRERIRLAQSALRIAQRGQGPFVVALCAAAAGMLDDSDAQRCFEIARTSAAQCDALPFAAAIEAVISGRGDAGMLRSFVDALWHIEAPAVAPLFVDVVRGAVKVDGKPVELSGRALELIVALALRRDTTSPARLAAMLWPDLEESASRNALSVLLHRVRRHLGKTELIVRDGDGYGLYPGANVDLWEIDGTLHRIRLRETLDDAARATLVDMWERLRKSRPARMLRWEWFEPIERRFCESRVEIAHRLATDALERGETRAALEYAADIIAYDACDEPARELTIRAYLREGDRAAAMRHFRQYRETLFVELQCEPSATIAALVMQ